LAVSCSALLGCVRERSARRRASAAEQTFQAEIFVYVGPVDSDSFAEELKASALLRCGVEKAREPRERRCKAAAIREDHEQLVFGDRDLLDSGVHARH
jgi:hypothetical protein